MQKHRRVHHSLLLVLLAAFVLLPGWATAQQS